jgi:hypothetical protein
VDDVRLAAVPPLIALARSADHVHRAEAGRALAVFADVPGARAPLAALLLDARDTFVTVVTAEALFRRVDRHGFALVAAARAVADDGHADWLHTAMTGVFGVFGTDRDAALAVCEALLADEDDEDDARVRAGARVLAAELAALTPVLRPAGPG